MSLSKEWFEQSFVSLAVCSFAADRFRVSPYPPQRGIHVGDALCRNMDDAGILLKGSFKSPPKIETAADFCSLVIVLCRGHTES